MNFLRCLNVKSWFMTNNHLSLKKKRDMEFKKKKNLFISNFMDKKGKII